MSLNVVSDEAVLVPGVPKERSRDCEGTVQTCIIVKIQASNYRSLYSGTRGCLQVSAQSRRGSVLFVGETKVVL
jgi:hypothetical protein